MVDVASKGLHKQLKVNIQFKPIAVVSVRLLPNSADVFVTATLLIILPPTYPEAPCVCVISDSRGLQDRGGTRFLLKNTMNKINRFIDL